VAQDDNQIASLLRRSVTPVLILDDDGVYADANDSLLRAFGRRRDELIGQRVGLLTDQCGPAATAWERYRARGSMVMSWRLETGHDAVIVLGQTELDGTRRHVAVVVDDERIDGEARLSPRERQVTRLLADGLSGEEIARELFLSPETVRTHIRNAMEAVGARTRAHLVALTVRSA
jgi:DNA-binding CsgD family transcriptional regulator